MFKKFFLIIICVLFLSISLACKEEENVLIDEEVFSSAIQELNNATNITIDMNMKMIFEVQDDEIIINSKSVTKVDGVYSYIISKIEDNNENDSSLDSSSESFVFVDGENIKVYNKMYNVWKLLYILSEDDYKQMNQNIWDIDNIDEMFVLENNVWVGNLDKLNDELSGYMDNLLKEYAYAGLEVKNSCVEKYEIVLAEGHVDLITVEMRMTMIGGEETFEYNFVIEIKPHSIGSTLFEIPDGL